MSLFLASVTGPDEAQIIERHGADIIDLKDSRRGAFGTVAPDVVAATLAAVDRRRPVSAVAGELAMEPDSIVRAAAALADAGVDYVKVALFAEPQRADCIRALSALARRVKLVGVMFAVNVASMPAVVLFPPTVNATVGVGSGEFTWYGSAASPYTVSVGMRTTPPSRRLSTTRSTSCCEGSTCMTSPPSLLSDRSRPGFEHA